MYIPVRKTLGLVLAVFALLGPLSAKSLAQLRPTTVNPALFNSGLNPALRLNPALNPALGLTFNPYVNPFAASALVGPRSVLAASGLTNPLSALPGYGFGLNSGALSPFSQLGYSSLSNSGGSGIYGGSGGLAGSLLSSAAYGAGYSYGYGSSSTQWMMNPYQGYLQGAADITRSQSEYQRTIQQAKLTRQEVIRSSLETRRATIEEAEWERAHMPDPEKIRQQVLERELTRARISPPLNDVWSARSLNTLLRHLITQQEEEIRGPNVPLNADIVNHVNVAVGNSAGNVGLLKNQGELEWPESLTGEAFKESRKQLNALMQGAYRRVESGHNPDAATLNNLLAEFRKMRDTLKSNVSELKPDEFIEAQRYLTEVSQTIKGLQDPHIVRLFSDDWKPTKARSVTELVKHMRDKGLLFAPATEKDQAAYVALYHALAAFDAGIGSRVVNGNSGSPDNAGNK